MATGLRGWFQTHWVCRGAPAWGSGVQPSGDKGRRVSPGWRAEAEEVGPGRRLRTRTWHTPLQGNGRRGQTGCCVTRSSMQLSAPSPGQHLLCHERASPTVHLGGCRHWRELVVPRPGLAVGVAVGEAEGSSPGGGAGLPAARCLPQTQPHPGPVSTQTQLPGWSTDTEPCSPESELSTRHQVLACEPKTTCRNSRPHITSCQKPGHQGMKGPTPCQLGAFRRKPFTDSNCPRGQAPTNPP